MKTEIRDSVAADIDAIVADIRQADADEMAALGLSVEKALREGMGLSPWCGTGLSDGVPVCMFGVAPVNTLNGVGAPWMLSTNGILKVRRPFVRACKDVMRLMLEDFPRLTNVVDTRNTVAIHWLKWMGFEVMEDGALPLNGQTFHVFRAGDWDV